LSAPNIPPGTPRRHLEELAEAKRELRLRLERERQAAPSGGLMAFIRYFWHVLEPVDPFVEGWPLECLCAHLEAITNGETVNIEGEEKPLNRLAANVPPGFMKLCADSTPILTPDGYRTHGDLRPGDRVFGPDGVPTEVVRISPKALADYEVTFSTHETIKCNGDHLWHVYDRWARKHKIIDTRELYESAKEPDRSRFFIPDTRCLQFPERELPLHPYFLGCWLGDGNSSKPAISHAASDVEHINKLDSLGYRVTIQYPQGKTLHSNFCHQGIIETLREMGLFKNKHIPVEYLTASEEQRLELLAGLIDTDGTVDPERGRCTFYTCSPELAEGMQLLVLSLGMRPYLTVMDAPGYEDYKSDKTYHLVGFQPDRHLPTAIPRKQVRRLDFARRKRAIVDVRKSASPEMGHCITVAREDGLYVVGRTNIVTHNSLTVQVFWKAWEWGPREMPHLRYVSFSYSPTLTERDNEKLRNLVCSPEYKEMWGHVFKVIGDGKVMITNDKTGSSLASSFGSVGTGIRGHRVILDDPHALKGTAETPEARKNVTTWVREAMQNRLNDLRRDAIVIIMQRLYEDDACGEIRKHLPKEYCHLIVPMEYEPNRHFSHYKGWNNGEDPRQWDGELAWEGRYPPEVLASFKANAYLWSGQYQQTPIPRGGGLFKEHWWQVHEMRRDPNTRKVAFDPPFVPIFVMASLDTAFSEKEINDFSALTVWAVYDDIRSQNRRILLLDAWKKQLKELHGEILEREPGESEAVYTRRASPKWGLCEWVIHTCNKCKVELLVIENKTRAHDVNKEIRRLCGDRSWGIHMEDPKGGDKWARANSVVDLFTDEMIYVPASVDEDGNVAYPPFAKMVIDEMAIFPKGAHDDIPDTVSMALKYLRRNGYAIRRDERNYVEREKAKHRPQQSPLYEV